MNDNDFQHINQKALRYLAYREHSRRELEQKLQGFDPDLIDAVLDDLAARDYQSDKRFAESYTRYRIHKGYGERYIRQILKQRGVQNDIIHYVLTDYQHTWFELAVKVQQKRFHTLPDNPKAYAKQMRFLQYRGFSSEQIYHALNAAS